MKPSLAPDQTDILIQIQIFQIHTGANVFNDFIPPQAFHAQYEQVLGEGCIPREWIEDALSSGVILTDWLSKYRLHYPSEVLPGLMLISFSISSGYKNPSQMTLEENLRVAPMPGMAEEGLPIFEDLLKGLLTADPEKRLLPLDALCHEWFQAV